jgi:hypothetical protein
MEKLSSSSEGIGSGRTSLGPLEDLPLYVLDMDGLGGAIPLPFPK